MYKNWKFGFALFWGWFEPVFGGFDPEKRSFEFFGMCNSVQLGRGEGKREVMGAIVVQKFPAGGFVKDLTAMERLGRSGGHSRFAPLLSMTFLYQ